MSPADDHKTVSVAFNGAVPILRVTNIEASLRYYVDVLGFKMDWRDDDDGPTFASVSHGKCQLFLASGDQGHPGSWLWVGVSDVDALHEELVRQGARVRHPPTNYPWGSREMHLDDPDGNVLRLGSANKPGEPFGDWLDGRGVLWRRRPEGGWIRSESS